MADPPPIAPQLLRYVHDYIDETNVNDAVSDTELDSGSNLIVFYRELFAQLFANVLHQPITGIDMRSGERARELYERRGREWREGQRALVRDYQHFCKLYPDLLGEEYGGGNEAVVELHFELLPTLLGHLGDWAGEATQNELRDAVGEARERYLEFMNEFEPSF